MNYFNNSLINLLYELRYTWDENWNQTRDLSTINQLLLHSHE